jgi:hypothetical protein
MTTVNAQNLRIDQTVQIFDEFYLFRGSVPAQEYDAVFSYLRSVFKTDEQAATFASTFFRISDASQIPAMNLLNQIKGQTQIEVTLTFAYYLNTFQSPCTMIGLNSPVTPNYYVAHNIRQ